MIINRHHGTNRGGHGCKCNGLIAAIMTSHRKMLLLVEDDDQRAAAIKACIPPDIHCVWAKSLGAALGVLKRDSREEN